MRIKFRKLCQLSLCIFLLAGILLPAAASQSPYLPKSYQSAPKHAKATVAKKKSAPTNKPSPQRHDCLQFPPFSAIDVNGPFQVTLAQGKQAVDFTGSVDTLSHLSARVVNNTLMLRWIPRKDALLPANPWISVKISTPYLRSLTVGGNTQVQGNGLHSSGLSIITYDQASLSLSGNFVLNSVLINSRGYTNISGVNGRHAFIGGSGPGTIRLSGGSTDVLTLRLFNGLTVEAASVHARKVYVAVRGHALAEVYPVDSLYAFASEAGNIYYYHRPRFLVRSVRDSGNVLYLGKNMQKPTPLPVPLN